MTKQTGDFPWQKFLDPDRLIDTGAKLDLKWLLDGVGLADAKEGDGSEGTDDEMAVEPNAAATEKESESSVQDKGNVRTGDRDAARKDAADPAITTDESVRKPMDGDESGSETHKKDADEDSEGYDGDAGDEYYEDDGYEDGYDDEDEYEDDDYGNDGYEEEGEYEEEAPEYTGGPVSISPSQNVMFNHLSNSAGNKKKGIAGFVLAVFFFAAAFFAGGILRSVTATGYVLAAIFMVVYGMKMFKDAKEEESLVSDVKRGYLRLEDGSLHCEQGVGTQYEEIHIPVRGIKDAISLGNASTRYLVIQFPPDAAEMLVNGNEVEEGIFEIRGGIYEEEDWNNFAAALNQYLPAPRKFDEDKWEEPRKKYKAFLIPSVIFAVLATVLCVLELMGIITLL